MKASSYYGLVKFVIESINHFFQKNKKQFSASEKKFKDETKKSNLFHAVSIKPDTNSRCQRVIGLEDRRFLASEAPTLPLPLCNKTCNCRYQHHNDRRIQEERRNIYGIYKAIPPQNVNCDRRHRADRRRVGIL